MLKQDRPFSCETHMSSHVALISSAPTRQQGHIFGYFLGKKNYLVITLSKVKMKTYYLLTRALVVICETG